MVFWCLARMFDLFQPLKTRQLQLGPLKITSSRFEGPVFPKSILATPQNLPTPSCRDGMRATRASGLWRLRAWRRKWCSRSCGQRCSGPSAAPRGSPLGPHGFFPDDGLDGHGGLVVGISRLKKVILGPQNGVFWTGARLGCSLGARAFHPWPVDLLLAAPSQNEYSTSSRDNHL